jgi:hypothetical protein
LSGKMPGFRQHFDLRRTSGRAWNSLLLNANLAGYD